MPINIISNSGAALPLREEDGSQKLSGMKRVADLGTTLVGLVGTTAGLTPFLLQQYRYRKRRPKLAIHFRWERNTTCRRETNNDHEEDGLNKCRDFKKEYEDDRTIWASFSIENTGKVTARGLEAKMTSIRRVREDGSEEKVFPFYDANLRLIPGNRKTNDASGFDLNPEERQFINLFQKNKEMRPGVIVVCKDPDERSTGRDLDYGPGHYKIGVKILNKQGIAPIHLEFDVKNGEGLEDLNINMKIIPPPPNWHQRILQSKRRS